LLKGVRWCRNPGRRREANRRCLCGRSKWIIRTANHERERKYQRADVGGREVD